MKKLIAIFCTIFLISSLPSYCAFWNKSKNVNASSAEQSQSQSVSSQNNSQSSSQNQSQTTYPQDVDDTPISGEEYSGQDIDIEQMYRDLPVPEFKYIHDIDPDEYQDTRYTTWSPYPLFRLITPLYFKNITVQPGYYLLTPREHEGAWFMLFKEAGRVKYIIPCYKREIVPFGFYKNNLPQIKLTTPQKIREKTLEFIGKHFDSAKRHAVNETFLEADDLDNNFISIIVYWGNYRYYMVLRSISL